MSLSRLQALNISSLEAAIWDFQLAVASCSFARGSTKMADSEHEMLPLLFVSSSCRRQDMPGATFPFGYS